MNRRSVARADTVFCYTQEKTVSHSITLLEVHRKHPVYTAVKCQWPANHGNDITIEGKNKNYVGFIETLIFMTFNCNIEI